LKGKPTVLPHREAIKKTIEKDISTYTLTDKYITGIYDSSIVKSRIKAYLNTNEEGLRSFSTRR